MSEQVQQWPCASCPSADDLCDDCWRIRKAESKQKEKLEDAYVRGPSDSLRATGWRNNAGEVDDVSSTSERDGPNLGNAVGPKQGGINQYPLPSREDAKDMKYRMFGPKQPKDFMPWQGLVAFLNTFAEDCIKFAEQSGTPEERDGLLEKSKLCEALAGQLYQLNETGQLNEAGKSRICKCGRGYIEKKKQMCELCRKEKRATQDKEAQQRRRDKKKKEENSNASAKRQQSRTNSEK